MKKKSNSHILHTALHFWHEIIIWKTQFEKGEDYFD